MRQDGVDRSAALRLLLAQGASTITANSFGSTALHDACLSGNLDTVRLIVLHETSLPESEERSLQMQDYDGLFPLHMLCNLASRGVLGRSSSSTRASSTTRSEL